MRHSFFNNLLLKRFLYASGHCAILPTPELEENCKIYKRDVLQMVHV